MILYILQSAKIANDNTTEYNNDNKNDDDAIELMVLCNVQAAYY